MDKNQYATKGRNVTLLMQFSYSRNKVCASKSVYFQRIRAFEKVYRFACAHFIHLWLCHHDSWCDYHDLWCDPHSVYGQHTHFALCGMLVWADLGQLEPFLYFHGRPHPMSYKG